MTDFSHLPPEMREHAREIQEQELGQNEYKDSLRWQDKPFVGREESQEESQCQK